MKSKLLFWLLITVLLMTGSTQAQQTGKSRSHRVPGFKHGFRNGRPSSMRSNKG